MNATAIATTGLATIGLDLAKNVFQVHGADAHGRVLFRKKLQRSQLAEFGVVLPKGLAKLRQQLPVLLQEPGSELTAVMRQLLALLARQLHQLDEPIGLLERQIRQGAQRDGPSRQLQQIPGVGPITASALAASVGDARQFEDGRQMAAWLGLVPRQHSSGGKSVLLGITKRGDKYLRTLLIHGARAALKSYQQNPARMPAWVHQLLQRKHPNVVCVAMASRTARVAWAMLSRAARITARRRCSSALPR